MEIRVTIPLRWRDMDMLGHLNQSVYHELLEEARGALLVELAEGTGHEAHHTFVLARVELDYRTEVRRDHGSVDVAVRVEAVGTKSVTLGHEVLLADGTVAASGRSVLVGWNAQERAARRLSEPERRALSA